MNHNNFRRSRSPPFGYYQPRPMNDGRDYDAYPPVNHYDAPTRNHPIEMLPAQHHQPLPPQPHPQQQQQQQQQQAYMDGGPHLDYSMSYRDHHRVPSSGREHMARRDPYMMSSMSQQQQQQPQQQHPRTSPPYKILCITNINHKISDGPIKEALSSDFGRFGDISVSVTHDSGERLAYIYFRNYQEARDARHARMGTIFFDRPIEIEPIYEPARDDTNGSPANGSSPNPMMTADQPAVYSPRRRSISPAPNPYPPSHDMNGPPAAHPHAHPMASHRRYPSSRLQMQHSLPPKPPMYPHHRSMTSPEYAPAPGGGGGGGYPYDTSPPIGPPHISPYDRRIDYTGHAYNQYPPPPPQAPHPQHVMTNSNSPYSSPPQEHYRSPYPPTAPTHHSSSSHHYLGPEPPHHQHSPHQSGSHYGAPMSRGERDRLAADRLAARSPRHDPYYPLDARGPPAAFAPAHPSSRGSAYSPPPTLPSQLAQAPPGVPQAAPSRRSRRPSSRSRRRGGRHQGADLPARFMSREFRREKFGADHPGDMDDGRPSRVLLVNNIDANKTELDLRETFETHGIIEDMEVKKVGPEISSALIKFSSMDGAYKAKTANDGRYIGQTRCRIVYGKVSASRKLWIGGLSPSTTVRSLEEECSKYGDLISMEYTTGRPYSYVEYESANQAQFAAHHLKSSLTPASERKIRVEFVDPERSDRLVPTRQTDISGLHLAETKSSKTNESAFDIDKSPRSTSGLLSQKRSVSPSISDLKKRVCQPNDIPMGAHTFRQERLAAAAAAKARTSSTTSSLTSHPSDRCDIATNNNNNNNKMTTRDTSDLNELNNNSDSNQASASNGNIDTNQEQEQQQQQTPTNNEQELNQIYAQEAPNLDKLSRCATVGDIVQCCSVSWPGRLALRNFTFPAQIYLCSGRKQLLDKYLSSRQQSDAGGGGGDLQCPLLSITQRWRLHPQPKLEEVKRRMQSGNLGMLIFTARPDGSDSDRQQGPGNESTSSPEAVAAATAAATTIGQNGDMNKSQVTSDTTGSLDKTESSAAAAAPAPEVSIGDSVNSQGKPSTPGSSSGSSTQSRPLRNLISYLEQKDAAGVISLSAACDGATANAEGSPKLLYTFPPGDFALNLLKTKASSLTIDSATEGEFLLGVIVGGNVEGKM